MPTFTRLGGYDAFTVSPDRKQLLALTMFGEALFWDVSGAQPRLLPWSVPGPVNYLKYDPDGRTFLAGDDQRLSRWDARAGRQTWALDLGGEQLRDVHFL